MHRPPDTDQVRNTLKGILPPLTDAFPQMPNSDMLQAFLFFGNTFMHVRHILKVISDRWVSFSNFTFVFDYIHLFQYVVEVILS